MLNLRLKPQIHIQVMVAAVLFDPAQCMAYQATTGPQHGPARQLGRGCGPLSLTALKCFKIDDTPGTLFLTRTARLRRLVNGDDAMANMKDIAKIAGVSLGTVSHVLNNSAPVREPIRKRVLEAVQVAGYQPSQLARGLRRDKTNIIGMVIPDITNPFFPAVVRGAEDVAFSNGFRLILCNTDNDHSKELVHLNELRTFLPTGLIVIPSNFSDLTAQAESIVRPVRVWSVSIGYPKTGVAIPLPPTTKQELTTQPFCFRCATGG